VDVGWFGSYLAINLKEVPASWNPDRWHGNKMGGAFYNGTASIMEKGALICHV
jgi:hypothetical protein